MKQDQRKKDQVDTNLKNLIKKAHRDVSFFNVYKMLYDICAWGCSGFVTAWIQI